MPTLRVIAHLIAKPDKIGETRDALTGLVDPTRAENGCIRYELMQNNSDPTDFTFVEEWSGDDALDAHLQSNHIKLLVSKAEELLAAAPDIRRYTLLA
jgi:quinol monooxygenase YgiN